MLNHFVSFKKNISIFSNMSICGFWWDFQILTHALENVSDKCFKNASSSGGKTGGGGNVLGTAHVLIYKFLAPSSYDFLHLPLSIEQQNWVRLANKGSLLLLPRSSWTGYMSSTHLPKVEGFTGGSLHSLLRMHLPCRRTGLDPWVVKIPWRREWQPTPVFLSGEFHGQRSHPSLPYQVGWFSRGT